MTGQRVKTAREPRSGAPPRIELLAADAVRSHRDSLAAILVECVEDGACVGYLKPYTHAQAVDRFEATAGQVASGTALVLAAFDGETLVGTVQIGLDGPCNQRHRGDVRKLLVLRRAQRHGLGEALMRSVETQARLRGLSLLCLDTATPAAARLYRRLGWTQACTIPGYALAPDGAPCDATFFWKALPR